MPMPSITLWTPAQLILTLVILSCCALLMVHRGRDAGRAVRPGGKARGRRPPVTSHDLPETAASGVGGQLILLAVFIAIGAYMVARAGDPLGVRPDSWSDANVIVSGRNYARLGLFADAGAAQHQVVTDANPPDPFFLYTRYPVGSNLINGLLQKTGVTSEPLFRLLPAIASLLAAGLWFRLLRRLIGGTVAVCATLALVCSYGFLAYADALHFHAYALLTVVGAVSCFVHALAADTRRRAGWLLLTALLMLLTACLTWEYHLWLLLFIALYALLFPSPLRRGWLALLVLPFVIGMALSTLQGRVARSRLPVVSEPASARPGEGLMNDIYRRTIGFAEEPDTPAGVTLATYPATLLLRFYKFHGLPAVGAAALVLMLLMANGRKPWRWRDWTSEQRLLVILLVAGAGWWVVMLQHTSVHPHVMRQGLTGFALLVALAALDCWRTVRSSASPGLARGAASVLLAVLGYAQIEGVVADLRTHLERGYEAQEVRERADSGLDEARAYAGFAALVPPGAVIVTNTNRMPLVRAAARRPVYDGRMVPPRPTSDANARSAFELTYNHLRQLYGERLPPLYFAYVTWAGSLDVMLQSDPVLRFFVLGPESEHPDSWLRARSVMEAAARDPGGPESFCPLVGTSGPFYVFKLDPAIPALHGTWSRKGFPTLRDFGPTR